MMEPKTEPRQPQATDTAIAADKLDVEACVSRIAGDLSRSWNEGSMTPSASRAMRRAREGNRDALLFLHARYGDEVYGRSRMILDDHATALDVTRRVFTRLSAP